MKPEELMIGDWVEVPFFEGKPKIIKVEEILSDEINPEWDGVENYGGIKIKYVNPVPLTPEILEKNGFEKNSKTEYHICDTKYNFLRVDCINLPLSCDIGNASNEEGYLISFAEIRYVHELQHALKLCGIEKQIEL